MVTVQNLYVVLLVAALVCILFSVRRFETGHGRAGFRFFVLAFVFGISPFVVVFFKGRGLF